MQLELEKLYLYKKSGKNKFYKKLQQRNVPLKRGDEAMDYNKKGIITELRKNQVFAL